MKNTTFYFILVAVAIFACNAADMDLSPEMIKFRDDCLKDSRVSLEDAQQWRLDQEPTTEQACFLKCLRTKMGVINEDGTPNIDKLKDENVFKALKEDVRNNLLNCIKNAAPMIECDDMKKFWKCYNDYLGDNN